MEIYMEGEFRTSDSSGNIPRNTEITLEICESSGRVKLIISSRDEDAVIRRMEAALGSEEIVFSYERARGLAPAF